MASQESLGVGEVYQEREETNPSEDAGGDGLDKVMVDDGNKTKARFYLVVVARKSSRGTTSTSNMGGMTDNLSSSFTVLNTCTSDDLETIARDCSIYLGG